MSGLHPQFMMSKRFPVHAAIEMHDLPTLASLLKTEAKFHLGRKLTDSEVSVLHQACCARPQPRSSWIDIVSCCLQLGAPVNEMDGVGQTPLFYAVTHCQAGQIVPLLLNAGANVNVQRWTDGWTPLHVAAMMGSQEVSLLLLQAGADTSLKEEEDLTPSQVARQWGHTTVADFIQSPRHKYRPQIPDKYQHFLGLKVKNNVCSKLEPHQLEWRDHCGSSLLHLVCWTGNIQMFKKFCQDKQGEMLLTLSNHAGLTPLAMAIINGQTEMVKEYLGNYCSKNKVDFGQVVITDTQQTLLNLLLLYCPSIHPVNVLQGGRISCQIANIQDIEGNTVPMALAKGGSKETVRRILQCKAMTEQGIFNFKIKNIHGQNILHMLVMNNDKHSVRMVLNLAGNDRDIVNCMDCSGMTPLMVAYEKGFYGVADVIIDHPKQKVLIDWSLKNNKGRTLTQQAEEAKKKRMELKESSVSIIQVKRKATKRNFRKEMEGNKENGVKEKQAKISDVNKNQINSNTINASHMNGKDAIEDIIMDDASEEVRWIQQMKKEQEEADRKADEKKKLEKLKEEERRKEEDKQREEENQKKGLIRPRKLTQEEKWKALKAKKEEEKNKENDPKEKQSQAAQLENIAEVMEKKRLRRLAAKNKMSEKEKEEQAQKAVRQAMYEEIIWALKLKKEEAEQAGQKNEVERYAVLIKEEEEKMDGTWERREKQKEKDRQERERQKALAIENEKLAKENEKLEAIKREAEMKEKQERQARWLIEQRKLEEERKKKQEEAAFEKLPKWKKEKILKEKAKAEETALQAKLAEEEQLRVKEQKMHEERAKAQEAGKQLMDEKKKMEEEEKQREEAKKKEEEAKLKEMEEKLQKEKRKAEEKAKQKQAEEAIKQKEIEMRLQEENEKAQEEERQNEIQRKKKEDDKRKLIEERKRLEEKVREKERKRKENREKKKAEEEAKKKEMEKKMLEEKGQMDEDSKVNQNIMERKAEEEAKQKEIEKANREAKEKEEKRKIQEEVKQMEMERKLQEEKEEEARKQEEQRKLLEAKIQEEKRKAEEAKQKEIERKQEEEKKAREEAFKKEEQRKLLAAKKKKEEEEKQKELARREEQRKKAEEEQRKKAAEEERRNLAQQRILERIRLKDEAEKAARQKLREEREKEEARKKAEYEAKLLQKKLEEEKKKAEEEAEKIRQAKKRAVEEENRRLAEKKAAEEAKQRVMEAKKKAAEEAKQKVIEAEKRAAEEARQKVIEAEKRAADESKQKVIEAEKRAAEEARQKVIEAENRMRLQELAEKEAEKKVAEEKRLKEINDFQEQIQEEREKAEQKAQYSESERILNQEENNLANQQEINKKEEITSEIYKEKDDKSSQQFLHRIEISKVKEVSNKQDINDTMQEINIEYMDDVEEILQTTNEQPISNADTQENHDKHKELCLTFEINQTAFEERTMNNKSTESSLNLGHTSIDTELIDSSINEAFTKEILLCQEETSVKSDEENSHDKNVVIVETEIKNNCSENEAMQSSEMIFGDTRMPQSKHEISETEEYQHKKPNTDDSSTELSKSGVDTQDNGNISLNDNNMKQSEQSKPKVEILNDIRNSLDRDQLEKLIQMMEEKLELKRQLSQDKKENVQNSIQTNECKENQDFQHDNIINCTEGENKSNKRGKDEELSLNEEIPLSIDKNAENTSLTIEMPCRKEMHETSTNNIADKVSEASLTSEITNIKEMQEIGNANINIKATDVKLNTEVTHIEEKPNIGMDITSDSSEEANNTNKMADMEEMEETRVSNKSGNSVEFLFKTETLYDPGLLEPSNKSETEASTINGVEAVESTPSVYSKNIEGDELLNYSNTEDILSSEKNNKIINAIGSSNILIHDSTSNGLDNMNTIESSCNELNNCFDELTLNKEPQTVEAVSFSTEENRSSHESKNIEETEFTVISELSVSPYIENSMDQTEDQENKINRKFSKEYNELLSVKEPNTMEHSLVECNSINDTSSSINGDDSTLNDKTIFDESRSNGDEFLESLNFKNPSDIKNNTSQENLNGSRKECQIRENNYHAAENLSPNTKDESKEVKDILECEANVKDSAQDNTDIGKRQERDKDRKTSEESEESALDEKIRLENLIKMVQEKIEAKRKMRELNKEKDANVLE